MPNHPRPRPLPPQTVANAAARGQGVTDAELLSRLEAALATLPPAERAAAVVAFGLDEGSIGVAVELGLSEGDADALSRSALQLLRGALADVDLDEPEAHPRLRGTGRRTSDPD